MIGFILKFTSYAILSAKESNTLIIKYINKVLIYILFAPVAQLDRALDSGSKGRGFESSRAHEFS